MKHCNKDKINIDDEIDNVLRESDSLLKASGIDKYILNPEMQNRFIRAAARGGNFLPRSHNKTGLKNVTRNELTNANFDFFIKQRPKFRDDYWDRLSICLTPKKRKMFVDLICNSWTDGWTKRNSEDIQSLKASIKQYTNRKARGGIVYVNETIDTAIKPLFTYDEILGIIDATTRLTELLMNEYVSQLPPHIPIKSTNHIWIHRGIHLFDLPDESKNYFENSYITSYSLSISVPEKFSKNVKREKPVLISGTLNEFYERCIFFSELIPDLKLDQFEFATIPHWTPITLKYFGKLAGRYEYEIESR